MLRRVSHKKPSYHTHSDSKLQFPHFKKLELSDRETIESFVSKYPPYSDFNFTSLWSYNVHDEAEFSFLNDNLVVKFHDYITGEPFYTFLGENKPVETVETLLKSAKENSLAHKLKLIPEVVAKALANYKHNFSIVEDQDSHDYIYSISEMALLVGNKYRGKRNFVNRFKAYEKELDLRNVDINDKALQEGYIEMFFKWEYQKNKNRHDTEIELAALKRLFQLTSLKNLYSLAIFQGPKVKAFSIFEIVNDDYATLHFLKADISYIGIYPYLFQQRAKFLEEKGIRYLNGEQDLGIENLRKSKNLGFLVII